MAIIRIMRMSRILQLEDLRVYRALVVLLTIRMSLLAVNIITRNIQTQRLEEHYSLLELVQIGLVLTA